MRLSPFANKHNRALRRIDQARRHMRPWSGPEGFPWQDRAFSERALRLQLDSDTNQGSRRPEVITAHIDWLLHTLQTMLPHRDDSFHVLDVGCGPGLYGHELARRGHHATGLDISPAALDHAREQASAQDLDCRFLTADLHDLPDDLPALTAEAFGPADAVTWWFGDFHGFSAARAPEIIARLARCLRPDGLFILEYVPYDLFNRDNGSTWDLVRHSPFSDQHHLWLQEYTWFADVMTEAHAHWILEIESGNLQEYCQCHQCWTDQDLDAMLSACGLVDPVRHPPVTGVDPELEFPLVITRHETAERDPRNP